MRVEPELVAAIDQSGEKFVHPEFFLIRPLADRVHQPPAPLTQVRARFDPGRRSEQLPKIDIVKTGIGVLIKFPFPRVIGLELDVEKIVIGHAILRRVHRRFSR